MNELTAFHGKQSIKDKYLSRLKNHYDLDEVVQGVYWEEGKGCAVGCTLHSSEHKKYEIELGIPEVLARLEDSIFETLNNKEAKKFPLEFLDAIPVGADLRDVWNKFALWVLRDKEHGVINYVQEKDKNLVFKLIDFYDRKNKNLDDWVKLGIIFKKLSDYYYQQYIVTELDFRAGSVDSSKYEHSFLVRQSMAIIYLLSCVASYRSVNIVNMFDYLVDVSIQRDKLLQLLKEAPIIKK